jgi:SAM-dependent methyltransferase
MVAILPTHQRAEIARAVKAMYTEVALQPELGFHFPTGRAAAHAVGYSDELLTVVPEAALAAFAGVGCPFQDVPLAPGETVLDVGAGSGTDAFIAAAAVGPHGRVIAFDVTSAMLERLNLTAARAHIENVETLLGDAEAIPLLDATVDVITTNGALNLVLNKKVAFAEIFRVLRAGGRLQLADVVLGQPVTDSCRADPRLWVECIVGATLESKLLGLLLDAGFREIEVLRRIDYFAASPSADTREIARALHADALVLQARKPNGRP